MIADPFNEMHTRTYANGIIFLEAAIKHSWGGNGIASWLGFTRFTLMLVLWKPIEDGWGREQAF